MATPIRVVLKENVDNLGMGGSVVRVRPGYARNFLIPRGLAVLATEGNLARIDELKRLAEKRQEAGLSSAQDLKQKLEAVSVTLARAVGEEGKMYGSVTTKDISEAFSAEGLEIDRRKVALKEPIKELGLAEVPYKLHAEVTALLRVEIVKK